MLGLSVDKNYIHAAILSDGGTIMHRHQTSTPRDSYRDCLLAIIDSVEVVNNRSSAPKPAGIALPGVMFNRVMQNAPLGWLNGKAIKQDLQASLGREIVISGYGACFTLYEALHGAGRGAKTIFGMHIDANCAGGFVADGRILSGANGIAGNWAHLPLPAPVPYELDGYDCWCGRTGCMEAFVSAEGMEQDYFKITQIQTTTAAIAKAAANRDIVAENTLQVLEDRLGRATSALITMIDPEVIVIGGIVGEIERLYRTVPQKWPGYVTVRNPLTMLVPAQAGTIAAAAGAALMTISNVKETC